LSRTADIPVDRSRAADIPVDRSRAADIPVDRSRAAVLLVYRTPYLPYFPFLFSVVFQVSLS
jgi:hypothetical protein